MGYSTREMVKVEFLGEDRYIYILLVVLLVGALLRKETRT